MSLVDGFRQGFGMMSDYYNRKDAKEYRQEQLGLQRRRMNMAEESHNANMETAGLNTQILQNQVNDLPAANKYRDETRGLSLDNQKAGLDAKRMQTQVAGQNLSNAKALGGYQAEDRKNKIAEERMKAHDAAGDYISIITDPAIDGTNAELLRTVQGADSAIKISEAIPKNDYKTVVDQSNILFKQQLNRNVGNMKGRNGGTIKDITIIDFAQQPDGSVKVPVRVTTDNGVYNSFISEMRGIDPNDPDKVFTAEDLYGTAASMGQLASILKASGAYDNVRDQIKNNVQRYFAPQNDKGNNVPAEVKSITMLSEMTGIPARELVEAKYLSQKDPSGATLRKTVLELAQQDRRWSDAEYDHKDEPEKITAVKEAIVDEYAKFLNTPESNQTQNPAPQITPTPAPDAAIQALRQDPSLADEFKAKYNYLPEGF